VALERLVFVAVCRGVRVFGGRSFAGHCEHFPSYSLYIINLDGSRFRFADRASSEDPQLRQYLELPTSILTRLLRKFTSVTVGVRAAGGPRTASSAR
jgi:hypothetical protein